MRLDSFAKNIKTLRWDILGRKQEEFAADLGVTQSTVSSWERFGVLSRSEEVVELIKEKYGVTDRDLFGFSDGLYAKTNGLSGIIAAEASETYAPLLGNIAAGDPREAIEFSGDSVWVPPDILERDPGAFVLRVAGDSMNQTPYIDGVFAVISPATPVMNGDVAAVKVNGDDVTLKIYKKFDGVAYLEPRSSNPDYKRIIIDETDPDAPFVRVLGKAVLPLYPIEF